MSAAQLEPVDPDAATRELLMRLARELPIDAFCELIAQLFGVRAPGEQTIEMHFSEGAFRWARVHSGKIGRDALDRLRTVEAHPSGG